MLTKLSIKTKVSNLNIIDSSLDIKYKATAMCSVLPSEMFILESFFDKKDVKIMIRLIFLLLQHHESWPCNNNNTSVFRFSSSFLSKNNSSQILNSFLSSPSCLHVQTARALITDLAKHFSNNSIVNAF